MNKIIESFKYIFSQKEWERKIGSLFAVMLAVYFVSGIISFAFQIPIEIMNAILKEQGREISTMSSSTISSMTSFISLPLTLYILGYLIDVVRNIAKGKDEVLPEHKDLGTTFVKGAKLYISMFIATLPTTIIGAIIFVITLLATITAFVHYGERGMYLGFGIVLSILLIVIAVLLAVINSVITYASWYIYFKTNSFRDSFNYKKIIEVIKNNEKSLLSLFLDFLVLGVAQAILGVCAIILICISFLTLPAVTMLGYFARAYIVGHAFKNMSKLELK